MTAITPTSGPTTGGTIVTITGTGFVSGATVDFGTVAATAVTFGSTTSLTATSPAGTGAVYVSVTTANGTSTTSVASQFSYVAAAGTAPITVSSALPPPIPVGTSLGAPVSVTVKATRAAEVTVSSGGAKAIVTVPAGALPAGTIASVFPVTQGAGLALDLPAGQGYIVSFAVSWVAANKSTPVAREPVVMVVQDRTITKGDAIDRVTGSGAGLTRIGSVTADKSATIRFKKERTFVIGSVPSVTIVAAALSSTGPGVAVSLSCGEAVACAGTATAAWPGKAKGGAGTVIAQGDFSIGQGSTATVQLAPTIAGRALLASLKGPQSLVVSITGTGAAKVTKIVTVRPAKKHSRLVGLLVFPLLVVRTGRARRWRPRDWVAPWRAWCGRAPHWGHRGRSLAWRAGPSLWARVRPLLCFYRLAPTRGDGFLPGRSRPVDRRMALALRPRDAAPGRLLSKTFTAAAWRPIVW